MAFRRTTGDIARLADQPEPVDLARLMIDEITWYMREHKMPRAELAQIMNVSPGRVSQILSGDENLTLRTLASVVTAIGAQVDFSLRPADEPADLLDQPEMADEFDDGAQPIKRGAAA